MTAKLIILTHKIAIQLHLVDTTSYVHSIPEVLSIATNNNSTVIFILADMLLMLDDRGSIPCRSNDGIFFLLATASIPDLGSTELLIQWVSGAFTAGVKRP